jgi:hypothetical protein
MPADAVRALCVPAPPGLGAARVTPARGGPGPTPIACLRRTASMPPNPVRGIP